MTPILLKTSFYSPDNGLGYKVSVGLRHANFRRKKGCTGH
jgi:hypothetical protein